MSDRVPPPKVAFVTLGCGRNEVDSHNAAGLLAASGYELVDDPEQADAIVVNTCAFIAPARQESIDTIFAALDLKAPSVRRLHNGAPAEAARRESVETVLDASGLKKHGRAKAVVVMGCLAERYTEELRAELPEADAVVPFADYARLSEVLGGTLGGPSPEAATPAVVSAVPGRAALAPPDGRRALPLVFPTPPGRSFPARRPVGAPVAYVKLAEGCDRDCSFCAIPSFRGAFRSRRPTEVHDEVAWLAGQGVSEVVLVAENSTSYGKDLGGRSALVQLLRDLAGVDGLRRVRLQYLQPDELAPGLLEEMAANPVVCSYFDLSLQHASEPVLRRMRRGGSRAAFVNLVARVRALDPDAAFRSNFILGFPGERAADVREVEGFLEDARLDWVAFFPYSPEEGTAAVALDGRVPGRTARARVERLQELQERLLAGAQANWLGRRLEVLVERVDDDGAEGRSFREGPESDGIVRVPTLTGAAVGDYVEVEVTAADGPELLARPVPVPHARLA